MQRARVNIISSLDMETNVREGYSVAQKVTTKIVKHKARMMASAELPDFEAELIPCVWFCVGPPCVETSCDRETPLVRPADEPLAPAVGTPIAGAVDAVAMLAGTPAAMRAACDGPMPIP